MGPIDDFYARFSTFLTTLTPYYPIILIIAGLILSIFIDLLIKRFKGYIIRNKIAKEYQVYKQIPFAWQSLKIVFSSVRIYIYFWIFLLSVYSAILMSFSEHFTKVPTDLETLDTVVFTLFVISLTYGVANIASNIINARAKLLASTSIFISIVRVTIYLLGLLVLLQTFHQDITWLLGTLGIAGLAVALALQDTLSNFFAGLYIIASRQIKPGHYIKLDSGEEGLIVDVNWRSTTLKALPNHIIIIPNSKVAGATITNYHLPAPPVNLYIAIGVHYESDLEYVEKVCLEVAQELQKNTNLKLDATYTPLVRYNSFGDSSINFNVIMRATEYTEQFLIKHEYIKAIQKRFNAEGITIPYPIRTLEFATELDVSEKKEKP